MEDLLVYTIHPLLVGLLSILGLYNLLTRRSHKSLLSLISVTFFIFTLGILIAFFVTNDCSESSVMSHLKSSYYWGYFLLIYAIIFSVILGFILRVTIYRSNGQ